MKPTKPRSVLSGRNLLRTLIEFLSIDFGTIMFGKKLPGAQKQLLDWFQIRRPLKGEVHLVPNSWRLDAKKVQDELSVDLRRIASSTPEVDEDLIFGLIEKIQKSISDAGVWVRTLPAHMTVPKRPKRKPSDLADYPEFAMGNFLIDRYIGRVPYCGLVFEVWGHSGGHPREVAYNLLGRAIEENCLMDLKRCDQCQNLYVRGKFNQKFCSPECKNSGNNKEKKEKKYMQTRRENQRGKKLQKARKLLKEGKSIFSIVEAVGLSERILRKARVVIQ